MQAIWIIFWKAVGWDIGIRVDMGPITEEERSERIEGLFGSVSNFEKYRLSTLLKKEAASRGRKIEYSITIQKESADPAVLKYTGLWQSWVSLIVTSMKRTKNTDGTVAGSRKQVIF